MVDNIVFQGLEDRRSEIDRHRENSSRMAEATARFRTTGQGSLEFPTRIHFGVTFMTKPVASYASEIDIDELDVMLGGDPHDNRTPVLPMCSGYVTDWEQNARGYYVGAYGACRVWFPEEDGVSVTKRVEVIHHFRFSAVGVKDIPRDLTS